MKNTEDEVLQAKQTADTDMTYYGDDPPFEESALEALEQAFNARKDYLELAFQRF
jgi:hypothetical protein